ncbi:MAG: hypothetical protein FWE61_03230 [Micrococcales bacterium]|nr:hypothetical protein [Micrococcales bacterium]
MNQTLIAPPGGWAAPWPLVVEIARVLPVGSWMLVDGLMVQLHARLAGVAEVRPTVDVDALVDVMSADVTMTAVASQLQHIGFEVVPPGWDRAPAHRLRRDAELST